MAKPHIKLASSLEKLRAFQVAGQAVVRSTDLSRTHLERLTSAGYLRPVVKGWHMPARPGEPLIATTSWFASMRDFVRGYCDERFKLDWYINAELSLKLHTGATTLPLQIQIHAPSGSNNLLGLPAGTSLFDYRVREPAPAWQRTVAQNLRALTLESAIVSAAPNFWQADLLTMRLALGLLKDASDLNRVLLAGDHTHVAGRVAGALRAAGRPELADDILGSMRAAGHSVVETNPFDAPIAALSRRPESPYCARLRAMWENLRPQVLKAWTTPVRKPGTSSKCLAQAEERYVVDAYHSLSIEGYQVSPDLIEKVRHGQWRPDRDEGDARDRNALAARGYYEAHLAVRKTVQAVLQGTNPGAALRSDLQTWHRAMWSPAVKAGMLKTLDLAGWRNAQVFIKNARHVPLPPEAVPDAMPLLFELLEQESEPCVRAVLGHFVFVFIHPYMDGNGRLARFIMNLMLSLGGWPWTVVTLQVREEYMRSLDAAASDRDIKPFTRLLSRLVKRQLLAPPKVLSH